MDEQTVRDVVLVQMIETIDQAHTVLSDDDRKYASRSARELAQWETHSRHSADDPESFLRHRAQQLLLRLGERHTAFASWCRRPSLTPVLSLVLPSLALLAGVGVDRIADPHRVDLLSAPLLLIVAWNLLVYAFLLVLLCTPRSFTRRWRPAWPKDSALRLRRVVPRRLPAPLSGAIAAFIVEWTRLGSALAAMRIGRALHLAAAMFALGAILSLYARGMLSEYVAGWESTFLNASQVHALLSALFSPALALLPLQGFSASEIESLRFGLSSSPASGARWVHLYAATLFILVVVPRLALAAIAHWRASRLQNNFPLDLGQPYFQRLLASAGGVPGTLRVLPYSFTVDEARDKNLGLVAAQLVGEQARVMLRPSVSYGEELRDSLQADPQSGAGQMLTAVLVSLAATPEQENHGAFLRQVVQACQDQVIVLVDEAAFLQRMAAQPGGQARLQERVALWREFCRFHGAVAVLVNLLEPEHCLAELAAQPTWMNPA